MRIPMRLLTLSVTLLVLVPAASYPPPPKTSSSTGPAVTLQAAPLGQLLDDACAHVGLNLPDQALDVGSLISVDKLIDPKETARFAAKGAVDKVPPALVQMFQKLLYGGLDEWKKNAALGGGPNAAKAVGAI